MRIYLQTRGRNRDYAFLGGAPEDNWWSQHRQKTSFEEPTVLVDSKGQKWKAMLSGIPSSRKDRVGTTIRYTLVFDGDCNATEAEDNGSAFAMIAAWIMEIGQEKTRDGNVQGELDFQFTEDLVERWLNERNELVRAAKAHPDASYVEDVSLKEWNNRVTSEVTEKLGKVLKVIDRVMKVALSEAVSPSETPYYEGWSGNINVVEDRRAFINRISEFINGKPGHAMLLNLLDKEHALTVANVKVRDGKILPDYKDTSLGPNYVCPKKKVPIALQDPSTPPSRQPNESSKIRIALLLFLLIEMIFFWFMEGLRSAPK